MAFEVIPELLDRVEFGGVGRELFNMEAGIGSPDRRDRRPLMNGPAIPEEDDVAPHVV